MADVKFKIKKGVQLKPVTSTGISEKGDLESLDSSGKLNYHNGTTASPVVTEAHTAALTNKTIDADANTISNIDNADIKAGAAIDAAKIADGSVSNTEFQYLDGVTSNIQDQLDATLSEALLEDNILVGNASDIATAVDTAVVGDIEADSTNGLTIKADVIVNADVNSAAAIARSKLGNGTADHVVINNGAGAFSSEAQLDRTRGGTGVSSTATFPTSGVVVTEAGAQTLTNKNLDDGTTAIINTGDPTKIAKFDVTSITTGTTRTFAFPDQSTTIAGTSANQVILNKDIDGGIATNTRRITIPKETKANLDALTRKEATIVYATDDQTVYIDNGTTLQSVSVPSFNLPTIQKFTTGTAQTYTTPTNPSPLYIRVKMVGGGGKGGGGGAGGTVGQDGSDTVWAGASITTTAGGGGGGAADGGVGGQGGIPVIGVGHINVVDVEGSDGAGGQSAATGNGLAGGIGGSTFFGGSGGYQINGNAGAPGKGTTGAGGQGGSGTVATINSAGGGGGGAYAEILITTVETTYTYTVGTGGTTGGAAGTNGTAGGNGADGMIIVEEYYQ